MARIAPILAALAAALTLGSNGSAQQLPMSGLAVALSFGARPVLAIEGVTSGSAIGSALGGLGAAAGAPPVQVVVDLPQGYTMSSPAPGTQVDLGILVSGSTAGDTGSATVVTSLITADDPSHYASDPAAQACAPAPTVAVWKLATTILGLGYTLPIFVGHPANDPQGVELRFCPPPLTGVDGKPLPTPPVPLTGLAFVLTPLSEPNATGSYTSSAFVTAAGSTGAPDPQTTTEIRFLRAVPHVLSVKGRYDVKTGLAVLTGRVVQFGKPQAHAVVEYASFSPSGTSGSTKQVRTSAGGTFTIHKRISKTTTFLLAVASTTGACQGTSTAPHGCASETIEGTRDKIVSVVVPKR